MTFYSLEILNPSWRLKCNDIANRDRKRQTSYFEALEDTCDIMHKHGRGFDFANSSTCIHIFIVYKCLNKRVGGSSRGRGTPLEEHGLAFGVTMREEGRRGQSVGSLRDEGLS